MMPNLSWMIVMPALILTANPPATTQPATTTATGFLFKETTLDEQTYTYCVYVPPEYTPERSWPVILALHGSGERGKDGFLQTDVGIGRAIRRHRDYFPAIVVMPQCRAGAAWTDQMAALALHCVEITSREYRLDPDRVYLTGLSLGGHGTWLLGARYGANFAALVPVCGFAELGQDTGLPEKLAPHLKDIPIWCFHGAADTHVPVEQSRRFVAAIRKEGGNIQYTEYPAGGHNVWDQAYDDAELWKWLFAQKRQPREDKPAEP
ncbi:MAG: PHB depolymerase family esterase [Phycisphaerae bacterium]|jgi:predicted peptidase